MDLSPKAIRYIVEAIDFQQRDIQQRLQSSNVLEDDAGDLSNDHAYLEEIKNDLKRHHDELTGLSFYSS